MYIIISLKKNDNIQLWPVEAANFDETKYIFDDYDKAIETATYLARRNVDTKFFIMSQINTLICQPEVAIL